jgi:hypothetical protein
LTSGSEAVAGTFEWFDRNSGWAPPDAESLAEWLAEGLCRCPDECVVKPGSACEHGLASWWLVLRSLERPDQKPALPPDRVVPHPLRLAPERTDYTVIVDAHHDALLAGEAGYIDPSTGLFVLTARTLWEQGSCCQRGCRHCPYLKRGAT